MTIQQERGWGEYLFSLSSTWIVCTFGFCVMGRMFVVDHLPVSHPKGDEVLVWILSGVAAAVLAFAGTALPYSAIE